MSYRTRIKMMFAKAVLAMILGTVVRVSGSADQLYEDFFFWKLGHMDGPHTDSRALGISRDGKTAVGATVVVDATRAWRMDVEWMMSTTEGVPPPLYNELFVQEDIGLIAPSRPSSAHAASNMDVAELTDGVCLGYNKTIPYDDAVLPWCDSKPVGTYLNGRNSYSVEWLAEVFTDSADVDNNFIPIQDFGGGLADMVAYGVSADGTVMVGCGNNRRGLKGFYAEMEDAILGLTDPAYYELTIVESDSVTGESVSLKTSCVQAVSEDGTVMVGYGSLGKRGNRAFVAIVSGYDETTGEPILESSILNPLDGDKSSEAYALTEDDDGNIFVAGKSDSEACIWWLGTDDVTGFVEWVALGIGGLKEGPSPGSAATGIAWRGDAEAGDLIVVGHSETIHEPSEAFVWTGNACQEDDCQPDLGDQKQMLDLEYILTKTGAGEVSGMGSRWVLVEATDVSSVPKEYDPNCGSGETLVVSCNRETRITGWGTNPERSTEAFVVTAYPDGLLDLGAEG